VKTLLVLNEPAYGTEQAGCLVGDPPPALVATTIR
jgi:hypothetical protein